MTDLYDNRHLYFSGYIPFLVQASAWTSNDPLEKFLFGSSGCNILLHLEAHFLCLCTLDFLQFFFQVIHFFKIAGKLQKN